MIKVYVNGAESDIEGTVGFVGEDGIPAVFLPVTGKQGVRFAGGTLPVGTPAPDMTTTAPSPPRYRDLWIASNPMHAQKLREMLGCRDGAISDNPCFVTYPSGSICGWRFHNTILGYETYWKIMEDERLKDWFDCEIAGRRFGSLILL